MGEDRLIAKDYEHSVMTDTTLDAASLDTGCGHSSVGVPGWPRRHLPEQILPPILTLQPDSGIVAAHNVQFEQRGLTALGY